MLEEHELFILLLGIGLLVFAWFKRCDFASIPYSGIIFVAYLFILTGWLFSVLEGFFYPYLLNIIEHIGCMMGSLFLALWAFLALARPSTQS